MSGTTEKSVPDIFFRKFFDVLTKYSVFEPLFAVEESNSFKDFVKPSGIADVTGEFGGAGVAAECFCLMHI